jgi:hypothetical protein
LFGLGLGHPREGSTCPGAAGKIGAVAAVSLGMSDAQLRLVFDHFAKLFTFLSPVMETKLPDRRARFEYLQAEYPVLLGCAIARAGLASDGPQATA